MKTKSHFFLFFQLLILDDGVELHKELAPENLGGFQNNLEKKLAELMKEFGENRMIKEELFKRLGFEKYLNIAQERRT